MSGPGHFYVEQRRPPRKRSKGASAEEADKMMSCAFAGISYTALRAAEAYARALDVVGPRIAAMRDAEAARRILEEYVAAGGPLWGATTHRVEPRRQVRRQPPVGQSW